MRTAALPHCCSSSTASSSYRSSFTAMAKGKNSPPPSKDSDSVPPRITSNVKQNLRFLRLWKEFQQSKSSAPRPATSYRRKKVQKEELPEEDSRIYRDPTIALYYTNRGIDDAVPVLLVDGYNVCGYWAKLKKHFLNGRLDTARQKLIDDLVTFSLLREVKVVVVFDAMMSGLPTHKENFGGVDIVYSGETCADAWIEKEVVALREDGCPKVWVVTSDHCQQHAAHGAGAFVWSSKALVSEIKISHKEVESMLQQQSALDDREAIGLVLSYGGQGAVYALYLIFLCKLKHRIDIRFGRCTSFQGRLLKHNLDAEVVDALKDLRRQLSENEI